MTRIAAIPTTYANVNFRSRLEARYAIVFDILGIRWHYEPLDLGDPATNSGYMPDFFLETTIYSSPQIRGPVLVEVKPIVAADGFREPINRIARSGWTGSAMVLGALPELRVSAPWGTESILGRGHAAVAARHADADAHEWYAIGYHSASTQFGFGGDDIERVLREATNRSRWSPR